MNKYNDEALCPEKFEAMAKEYALNKKQIEIKNINSNTEQKSKLLDELSKNLSTLLCNFDNLTKHNLSKQNKDNLNTLQEIATKIKTKFDYTCIATKNANYCVCLQQSITVCTKVIKYITQLQAYYTYDEFDKYLDLQLDTLQIIDTLGKMFGICPYRKI